MSALAYVLIALASYRLARVITTDTLTYAFRDALYRFAWDDENGEMETVGADRMLVPKERAAWRTYVHGLFTCPVCLGVWMSAGVYSAWRWLDYSWVHAIIAIFAVAGLQCFLATREGA